MLDLTENIAQRIRKAGVNCGIAQLFLHHSSAALLFCENADPDVQRDLEAYFQRLIPDGDPLFRHRAEGPDDMPAHVRTVICGCDLGFPLRDGRPDLGTWQGIYLWEHRANGHSRKLTMTIYGE